MAGAEDYRRYAAECVRVARQATNVADKSLLLDMAERWRALAERAERNQSEVERRDTKPSSGGDS